MRITCSDPPRSCHSPQYRTDAVRGPCREERPAAARAGLEPRTARSLQAPSSPPAEPSAAARLDASDRVRGQRPQLVQVFRAERALVDAGHAERAEDMPAGRDERDPGVAADAFLPD